MCITQGWQLNSISQTHQRKLFLQDETNYIGICRGELFSSSTVLILDIRKLFMYFAAFLGKVSCLSLQINLLGICLSGRNLPWKGNSWKVWAFRLLWPNWRGKTWLFPSAQKGRSSFHSALPSSRTSHEL